MKIVFNITNIEKLNLLKDQNAVNIEAILAQILNNLIDDKKDYFQVKTPLGTQLLFEIQNRSYWADDIKKFELTFEGFYHE